MQAIQNTGETFQYVYGQLRCSLVVIATKNGTKEKLSWLPRICSGSIGTFPPESDCADLQQLQQFNPTRFLNLDGINKIYMHERFGANQQTNKREKRNGPSILCQSAQPQSTIALIYKRPIIDLYESSDDSYEDEEEKSHSKRNKENKRKRINQSSPWDKENTMMEININNIQKRKSKRSNLNSSEKGANSTSLITSLFTPKNII